MVNAGRILERLEGLGDPQKAVEMAAYHKVERHYLGIANPVLDDISKDVRVETDVQARVDLAAALWDTNTHEARVLAAKLLTQARLRPDDTPAWELIASWVPDFDAWAIADHVCIAGQKRLVWNPSRLDTVEEWTRADHMWTKRAALVITLPWTKQNFPKPAEEAARDRILGWAAGYVEDQDWFIQKAIAWWLRELSKHDAPRVRAFLAKHSAGMKNFAVKDASRKLPRD